MKARNSVINKSEIRQFVAEGTAESLYTELQIARDYITALLARVEQLEAAMYKACGKLHDAQLAISGVQWVRRWTGGGVVDHRADWTYTVVAPTSEPLAHRRGAESYQHLHQALEETLRKEGQAARLSTGAEQTGAALCFENPVPHDLVGGDGRKLAGAGQRRTRQGLLHQGSVAAAADPAVSLQRAKRLATHLSAAWQIAQLEPPSDWIARKSADRYGAAEWTHRR